MIFRLSMNIWIYRHLSIFKDPLAVFLFVWFFSVTKLRIIKGRAYEYITPTNVFVMFGTARCFSCCLFFNCHLNAW